MTTSIASIMESYIEKGRAKGITDESARSDIGRACGGQSIFVERQYMGGRGRIFIANNGSEECRECHDLCSRSSRWYYLAAI